MCGFTGWYDPSPQPKEVLERMTAQLFSRGPDASGLYCNGPLALGHRRLSIIDLAASHQPMIHGKFSLAFNGEIYNFLELKAELERLGHTFQTHGDTEVLLHALIEWKELALSKLQGMFAFAFWDGQQLLLARDHLGVKPLYISWDHGRLLFASELKALLQHPSVSREIDPDAIGLYLECQYIPAPYSIFRHIRKLPAAHYLLLKDGQIEQKRYWTPSYSPKFEGDEEEAIREAEKLLRKSVRSMLVSDVPLGAFVSGGIDSSLIASMMQEEIGKKTKIFSIALKHVHSEQEHAERVAKFLGADFHPFFVNAKDIQETLNDLFDEPFGDQAALPTLLLSKLTRKHVTVALTGEGADEIFAGYSNYHKRLKEASICNRWAPFYAPFHKILPGRLRKNRLLKAMAKPPSRRYTTIPNLFDREIYSSLLSRPFRKTLTTSLETLAETQYFACNSNEYLDKMLHIDTSLWLADDLLTKVDRATMAHSLEARVPYLDHKLVEFAASLPANFKLRGTDGKYILKRIASKGYLPTEIISRPKWGFVIPLKEWMAGELKPLMDDALASLQKRNLFRNLPSRKDLHATRLFALLSLELWFRRFAPEYTFK
ncbi:MAG: asparagine synthase (glutamine-hydrolyzing) [Parachlamydiales bacterium]|nr:asparagine synthase (glutamine-hydrolyzing) [Parachlamydiales bacterium]